MTSPDISLGRWFAARAARSAHRRALTFEGRTRTYGELLSRIDRLAAALRTRGVSHGDRVAFLGANQPAFLETLLATARLGAVFVPLNFRLAGPELAFIIRDSGANTLVTDSAHQPTIDKIRHELTTHCYLIVGPAEAGWENYEDLIATHSALPAPDSVLADETAIIMYTSGTTGRPKGVILSHANLWWSNINLLSQFDVHENDVTLVAAPLFHIAGLNVTTFTTWFKGGEVVLQRSFDAADCLAAIERHHVTTMFGVPAIFLFMSQAPAFPHADLSSLRMAICGGAPVPEPLLRLYAERNVPILQGYGLTETAPSATFLVAEYALSKLGSAGTSPIFTDVKIVDADGRAIEEPHRQGEICVRGPNVTKGYWNRPEDTTRAIDPHGWFHTGDVGYRDDDGFMFIVDRIKDMIISGGENIYPAEVENILCGHPAIAEVAVIGVPDDRWGEAVTAVVTFRLGHEPLTLEELRDFAGASLARYKLPTKLQVVDALPRNSTGKVVKYLLRQQLQPQRTASETEPTSP
ncbi:acyl-CoA synthetase [Nocardia pseudovaccinii]|uniref:acyl-CoA synthetase n=1 Tax=Nocardia pseudovaccinii TaxID=189540 RepID=UPI0007A45C5A|nr:long-chain fatty acid--CoA ligase [Nocardia pseudovaccinii]